MCEIVNKFIDLMKPFVLNIEADYQRLKDKEQEFNNLDNILELIANDSFNVLNIELEQLTKLLDNFESNQDEFKANKYILQSKIDEVKALPQYAKAKKYIDDFLSYLLKERERTKCEYQELSNCYEEKELINKYYQMFVNNKVFVDNEQELIKIFNVLEMECELKNNLLIYILKENNKSYYNDKAELFTDLENKMVLEIIKDNQELDSKEYNELIDAVDEYVDLTKKINLIVDYNLIKKINVCNIVLAKKIWLYKKIKFAYYNMNCNKCNCIIKEFNEINDLYEKIKIIKNQEEIVRIIKGES